MDEKNIKIDVEVIKKPQIYKLYCVEASVYEPSLPETVSNPSKWQSLKKNFKDKINRKKV